MSYEYLLYKSQEDYSVKLRGHNLGGGEYYNSPCIMNIKWDYSYYQPWSDNEQLVNEMLAMLDGNITMQ